MRYLFFLIVISVVMSAFENADAQGLQNEIKIQRPDFSGKWSIDVAKSRFSSKKGPVEKNLVWIVTISQRSQNIIIKMDTKSDRVASESWEYTLQPDGRPKKFGSGFLIAKWTDKKLIVQFFDAPNEIMFEQYRELVSELHFELLPDGNTLQIVSKFAEGRWGYNSNPRPNVIDEQYSEYLIFSRVKN